MSYKETIPMCFRRDVTAQFGLHSSDEEDAVASIAQAKREGASFEDYASAICYYIISELPKARKKGLFLAQFIDADFIIKQVKRAKEMWDAR